MKDKLGDSIGQKISGALKETGGARVLFGDPVRLDGMDVVPVGRVTVVLGADAEGSGGGDAAALAALAKGGGGGNAGASMRIEVEPTGYLYIGENGPDFVSLEDRS